MINFLVKNFSQRNICIKNITEIFKDKRIYFISGCEFVKAVSGFHCRLCDAYIKDAAKVVPHINDKLHRNNYQVEDLRKYIMIFNI